MTAAEREVLVETIDRMVRTPLWQAIRRKKGWRDAYLAGDDFAAFLRREQARVTDALRDRWGSRNKGLGGRDGAGGAQIGRPQRGRSRNRASGLVALTAWDASRLTVTSVYGMGPQAVLYLVAGGFVLLALGHFAVAARRCPAGTRAGRSPCRRMDRARPRRADHRGGPRPRLHPGDGAALRRDRTRLRAQKPPSPTSPLA